MKITTIYLVLYLFMPLFGNAQSKSFGDSGVREALDNTAAAMLDQVDSMKNYWISQPLLTKGVSPTRLAVFYFEGKITHILANTYTSEGILDVDLFFTKDQLIYVSEIFQCFSDREKKSGRKKQDGSFGWESQFYFQAGSLKFHEHFGRPDASETLDSGTLIRDAARILGVAKKYK